MKKITKIIYFLIIFLIISFSTFLIILNVFGYKVYAVESDSMAPTIYKNALVVVRKLDDEDKHLIKKDDIVAFIQNGKHVMHRVVEIDDEKLITKGDNNSAYDNPITYDHVIGCVMFWIPLIGIMFLSYYPWIILSLILILFILIKCIIKELGVNKGEM